MQVRLLGLAVACAILIGARAPRWEPQRGSYAVALRPACPGHRAPAVADFGAAGVRPVYFFETGKTSPGELAALRRKTRASGYVLYGTIIINIHQIMFAIAPAALHEQKAVDEEFQAACQLGGRHVFLTDVRYPLIHPGSKRLDIF